MNNLINYLRKNPAVVISAVVWVFYAIFHVRLLSLGHDSSGFFQAIYEGALQEGFDFSWFHPHHALVKGVYILLLKALFFLGILLIVVGIQSLSIGLIGELIVNNGRKKSKKIKEIIHKK